jgi:type IV pilus assembly protein PilQ
MLKQSGRKMKMRAVVCSLGMFLASVLLVLGCATTDTGQSRRGQAPKPAASERPSEDKMITGISIEETADTVVVSIQANHVVDYTLAEPPLQQAKVIYFPDSGLSLPETEYPVNNEIIGVIEAVELVKGGPSKIIIPVKEPQISCDAHRGEDETTLLVVFPKGPEGAKKTAEVQAEDIETLSPEAPADVRPAEETNNRPMTTASLLKTVDVSEEGGRVVVNIKADGTIREFKNFTLKNPPRIVLDLAGLATPYKKEQRVTVGSEMVQQVRHCIHKGFVRVVLDVSQAALSDYKVVPAYDGLTVYVGNTAELSLSQPEQAPLPSSEETSKAVVYTEPEEPVETAPYETETASAAAAGAEEEPAIDAEEPAATVTEEEAGASETTDSMSAKQYDRPALVNQIDFIDDKGKSTIRIGTTHPVNFDLVKTGEKKVQLKLDNADILSFRQRPLITTRFESAINSILPVQTQEMKENKFSVVNINLREDVGYNAEQDGNLILVHFEPSSVPPEPAQEVVIPTETVVSKEGPAPATPTTETAPVPTGEETAMTTPETTGAEEWTEETAAPTEETDAVETTPQFMGGQKPAYTGEPIALEFYKTDIRNVIRIIKDVSGKNFAIDEDVAGSVSLSFVNPVPWDQVLDLILEMNDLGMVEQNGIVRISTKATILKQKEAARAAMAAEQELKTTQEQLAPLVTEYFAISYSDASADILPHIEDILTPDRGHAKVDTRTNQLIMTDIQEKVDQAREIIAKIDKVTPQVMINARMVETNTNFSREFGTEWGIDNSPGTYRHEIGGTYTYDVAMNNPASSATNSIGINFSRIVGTPFSLDAKLSLMETVGEVRIISSPRVVTLDNKKAAISQGQEIPYTTVDDGEADTQFKDADLKLEVTPHVTPDNRISMKIHIEEKEVGEMGALSEPPLNTKQADTELLVNDGDTIVIGGIIQETDRESQSGIPYLSKIPILGHLFKEQMKSNEKSELLIFITPTIVRLD